MQLGQAHDTSGSYDYAEGPSEADSWQAYDEAAAASSLGQRPDDQHADDGIDSEAYDEYMKWLDYEHGGFMGTAATGPGALKCASMSALCLLQYSSTAASKMAVCLLQGT